MKRRILVTTEEREEFGANYIPVGLTWRICEDGEDPFESLEIGDTPIYASFFVEAGLRIPLAPLLIEFLRFTNLHLCQLAPNTLRIILGVVEINRILGTNLGMDELRFCYCLSKTGQNYCLR